MTKLIEIPNKSRFKLNEVCSLTGVKPYVLRFWESEFEEVSPILSSSGQKLYQHKDIEAVALIKKFLFEDKMSIEKAKAEVRIFSSISQNENREGRGESEQTPPIPEVRRLSLSDNDISRLVQAKEELNKLLGMTDDFKSRHNW